MMKTLYSLILFLLLGCGVAWAEPVDINSATKEELSANLNGVGDAKAAAIIEYREKNGKFTSIDQLTNVKGIGEKILEKNKDVITLAPGS